MPAPRVVRPRPEYFWLNPADHEQGHTDLFSTLEAYLKEQWQRAFEARCAQIDDKYTLWQKNYDGVPKEERRVLPWPGASNYVVQVSRMFIDTFIARTLNIIFATRPLYVLDFLKDRVRESTEKYLNKKALVEWRHYDLCRGLLFRGGKNGTVVTKTTYEVQQEYDVTASDDPEASYQENLVTIYDGPKTTQIPFEDFYLYPITCNYLDEAEIIFHRIRLTEEAAVQRLYDSEWPVDESEIRGLCTFPTDIKRDEEQQRAGVADAYLRELQLIECHLKYDLFGNGRYYQVIVLLEPSQGKIFDLYFNPYPRNMKLFQDYRPLPKEDFFFGDSWVQVLMQSQEEASQIHNDRRNSSYIANAPFFKRKRNSLVPNPSTSWYPGKVWDVEAMDDFDAVMMGRPYTDMLAEENHVLMLAERLVGIGALQQGNAAGMMGKRGIYNAAGTLAVISESNQRQDTNIRDARQVMGSIAKREFMLQSQFNPNDPMIDMISMDNPAMGDEIRQGLTMLTSSQLAHNYFEIKASDAGANSETAKANALQLIQVIGQYGASIPQMATQIRMAKDPFLRDMLIATVRLQKWAALTILRAFGNYDAETYIPDIERALGGPQGGTQGLPAPNPAGQFSGASTPPTPDMLASLANLSIPNA